MFYHMNISCVNHFTNILLMYLISTAETDFKNNLGNLKSDFTPKTFIYKLCYKYTHCVHRVTSVLFK